MVNFFDEEQHKYFVNDVEVPSVTEIAETISFKRLNDLTRHILERASRSGSHAHALA